MSIRIIVAGATGRMGQEVVKMIQTEREFDYVAGVSRSHHNEQLGDEVYYESVADALSVEAADVFVDFTTPQSVKENMEWAIQAGVRPVVGTTGLLPEEIEEMATLCEEQRIGAVVAPNFSVGAVLLMKFAAQASKYLSHVEIIESHHNQKLDAPSGTAWKTAELIAEERKEHRQGHPAEKELLEGVRGGYYQGFRIHSVRLPGLLAHQEVYLAGEGELLTLRHDSLNRESFMSGVKLAVEKVMQLDHLVYGLEHIIQL